MNTLIIKLATISVFSILLLFTNAQFTINPVLRTQAELRKGYSKPTSKNLDPAFFIAQRTRLNLAYKNDFLNMKIALQDVRVWGDEAQLKNTASFGLHEAWAELSFAKHFTAKIGRQEIAYNDERLMGSVDWAVQARSHDALIIKYHKDKINIDIGGAFNQLQQNLVGTLYPSTNYKVLSWLNYKQSFKDFTLHGIFINDAYSDTDTTKLLNWNHTIGAGIEYNYKDLSFKGDFYWQEGKRKYAQNISAYMLALQAEYQINKFIFGVNADFVSGNKLKNKKYNTFNTLYATNHKFYGFMDYFTNIPKDTKGGGLNDFYATIKYKPIEKLTLSLTYHQFFLNKNVAIVNTNNEFINKNLGGEFDFVLNYNIKKYANFKFGNSTYLSSQNNEYIKGGESNKVSYWAWTMITINPEIFNSDNFKRKD